MSGDRLVEGFPKAQEDGPVQMAPVAAQLQDGHIPLLNVGVCLCLVVLQMKGSNWRGNMNAHTHVDLIQVEGKISDASL